MAREGGRNLAEYFLMGLMNKNVTAIVCFVVLSLCVACTGQRREYTLPNSSMEPTILEGEKFVADTRSESLTNIQRGDLVIIIADDGAWVVKRVIAIAGDRIEGKDLKIFLNGNLLTETYIQHMQTPPVGAKTLESFPRVTVGPGQFFVMGDNRDVSFDSRDPAFGMVSFSQLRGRPETIVSSPRPDRVGKHIY